MLIVGPNKNTFPGDLVESHKIFHRKDADTITISLTKG